MQMQNYNATIKDGFQPMTERFIENKNYLIYIQMSRRIMFSNANPSLYVHDKWMDIVESTKPCQKCPLHTILPTP